MKKLLLAASCRVPLTSLAALPEAVMLECGPKGRWVVEYEEPNGKANGAAIMYEYPEILPQYYGSATPTSINVEREVGGDRVMQILVDRFDGTVTWKLFADNGLRQLEANFEPCRTIKRLLD